MQSSVIAHIFMTAFQCGHGGGARVVLCLFGLADLSCACNRVQAAMSKWGMCILRIQQSGEAGTKLRFAHVAGCNTVCSITVASDFT